MERRRILKHYNYDPHEHRTVLQPINNLEAFISLIKCSIGTGILAMPMAFSRVGWLLGIISIVSVGSLVTYTLNLLLNCIYDVCKRIRVPQLTYAEAMQYAMLDGPPMLRCFAKYSGHTVDIFLAVYHFGVCSVYIVFVAGNIKAITDIYVGDVDARLYMVVLIAPLILIFMIRDIKHLVPFSALANICILYGIGVVFCEIFYGLPPLSDIKAIRSVEEFPLFYGTVLFAVESVGVIIAIESSMRRPKDFVGLTGIMCIGMVVTLTLYGVFGLVGYWHYGDDIEGSVALNLPKQSMSWQITNIMFGIGIFFTYALQGYVTINVLWTKYIVVYFQEDRILIEMFIRILMVLGTVFFAVAVTDQSLFISLVGSLCLSVLGLIFPAIMDICLRYRKGYGPKYVYLVVDLFIIACGLYGGVMGTLISILEIWQEYYIRQTLQQMMENEQNLSADI